MIRLSALWIGILSLLGLGGTVWLTRGDAQEPGLKIIDTHIHAEFPGTPEETTGIPQTLEELQREMKESGVVGAISHTNRDRTNYQDLSRLGIFHCGGIRGEKKELAEVEAGLKSKKFRCVKVYLGYTHKWAYDPSYAPFYRLARKYEVPVVFHTGDTYSTKAKLKYSDPLTIDEVAVDFPEVTFVIAHLGNPWINSAAEVAYKNPNVYVEASAVMIGNLAKVPDEYVERYMITPVRWAFGYIENPKKFMFGTDWVLNDIKGYVDAYKKAIPQKYWNQVFYENAKAVFKAWP